MRAAPSLNRKAPLSVNILFVADSLEKIKPLSDTTLVFLRQCLKLKHKVSWATDSDVEFSGDKVIVHACEVKSCEVDAKPALLDKKTVGIDKFKLVFIRKDPPFDSSYVRLCWILALAEKKTTFLNSPSQLLRYHEKLVPLEALAQGFLEKKDIIPTHLGSAVSAKHFVNDYEIENVIIKPFLGFGGTGVELRKREDFVASSSMKYEDIVVQPFHEEVVKGDHRVFFLEGKMIGSFARIPKEGGFISNLAQGGSAKPVKLTSSQLKVMERTGKFLKKTGIFFAGADLIGNYVSEVNITSPTGLVVFEKLFGVDLSEMILKAALKRVGK